MKFMIVSRDDERSRNMKAKMKQYLIDFDLVYNKEDPELVISIGGDGTLLEAFRRYVHKLDKTSFRGVHSGHIGFYTDWTYNELEKLVIEFLESPFHVVEYPLLEVNNRYTDEEKEFIVLALYETTIKTVEGSVVFDVQ